MRHIWILGTGLLAVSPVGAAAAQDGSSKTIQVTGIGSVNTPPDVAGINYTVRGEGATSDDAVRAMNAKKAAVEQAIGAQSGGVKVTTGTMQIGELRGPGCALGYDRAPQASDGGCAVRGYSAQMFVVLRVRPAASGGTLSGVAAKAGAVNVMLSGFSLSDPQVARRRALDAAAADGQAQAEAIARATGVKLGALIRISDPNSAARYTTEDRASLASARRMGGTLEVSISPEDVTTSVALVLTYQVEN